MVVCDRIGRIYLALLDLFELNPKTLRTMLATAMSQGGDFADIFCEYSQFNTLILEEGILKTANHNVERGVGVRVIKGEKTGYAYTEILDDQNFHHIAKTAAAIAEGRGSGREWNLTPKRVPSYYPSPKHEQTESHLEQKIAWLNMANHYARAYDPSVTKVIVSISDSDTRLVMADSRGQLLEDHQPLVRMTVSAIAEREGVKQKGRRGDGGRVGLDFITEEKIKFWAEEAAREALVLLEAQEAPSGNLPVILGPGESGILLHESIGHPLEADFNRKGTSAYSGRIGDQVADSQCTIVDDGTVQNDRGAINIDDELNSSQRTVLIEEGRLRDYMFDEMSARFFDRESTGNGRRESYRFQPLPRMRSTYMLPGAYDPGEIIQSTAKGIFCKTFKGGQVDISNGNFVFIPNEAYLIENGEVSHPINKAATQPLIKQSHIK